MKNHFGTPITFFLSTCSGAMLLTVSGKTDRGTFRPGLPGDAQKQPIWADFFSERNREKRGTFMEINAFGKNGYSAVLVEKCILRGVFSSKNGGGSGKNAGLLAIFVHAFRTAYGYIHAIVRR